MLVPAGRVFLSFSPYNLIMARFDGFAGRTPSSQPFNTGSLMLNIRQIKQLSSQSAVGRPNQSTTQPYLSHLLYNRLYNLANLRQWSSWRHFCRAVKWKKKNKNKPHKAYTDHVGHDSTIIKMSTGYSYWFIRDLEQASPLTTACLTLKAMLRPSEAGKRRVESILVCGLLAQKQNVNVLGEALPQKIQAEGLAHPPCLEEVCDQQLQCL